MTVERAAAGIHIGLPRTGTTTLQTHLFAAHSQIHYLGIVKRHSAARWRARRWPECRDREVAALMRELVLDGSRTPRMERCASRWRAIAAGAAGKVVVWSWEGLAADTVERREERARRLAATAGGATVLVAIRDPVGFVESTYFQILRRNNWSGVVGEAWHRPIDAWLAENLTGELEPLLDYERTIDVYCRHFGEDAVRVLLYEDLARDPAAFVASVCRALGVDEAEGLRRAAGRRENATSPELIDAIRRLDRGVLARLRARLAVARQVRGALPRSAGAETPRIGAAGRAVIAERTRAGNRRLAQRFALDLERWGYPL